MQNEKDIYEASDDSQYGDKKAECEYGESREEDETTQYNNYTVEENSKKNMYGTEDNDQLTRLNIDCVEIEQCQVRPNCLRTLMMQVEDRTDTKRFDVIQQTTTNDGFEYFSTLFGDIQQAINYLRNYPNNDSAKMKRKNNELEYTNPDFSVHKSARTRKKRCITIDTHSPPLRQNTQTYRVTPPFSDKIRIMHFTLLIPSHCVIQECG